MQGTVHELQFNQMHNNPLLTIGWTELSQFLNLPKNVEIYFSYYGNQLFGINSFKEKKSYEEIMPFHSRSIMPLLTKYFDIILTPTSINQPNLVSLTFISHIFLFLSIYYFTFKLLLIHIFTTLLIFFFQTLPRDFGFYLLSHHYGNLLLCGDYNHSQVFNIVSKDNPTKTILEKGWDNFCIVNHFIAGDTIRFKFLTNDPHKRCHAFKHTVYPNVTT
jgi:hypothetical protein